MTKLWSTLGFILYSSLSTAEIMSPIPLTSSEVSPVPTVSIIPVPTPTPTESPSAIPPITSERKLAVVVVNGGYNSCAGGVPASGEIAETNYLTTVGSQAITHVITPLKDKGYEVYWIISCFWGSTSNTLQVKTSTNPTHADIIPWSETGASGQTLFYTYLTTRVQTYLGGISQEVRLILIGHSNGGYNALKLAEGLADSTSFATLKASSETTFVPQVHTLDPINVSCSPSSISAYMAFNYGAMPPQCLRAPTATEVNYTKIRDEFGVLDNYYQTDYSDLHSGAISLATSNTRVPLPGTQSTSNNAHTRITSDSSTWSSISNQAVP